MTAPRAEWEGPAGAGEGANSALSTYVRSIRRHPLLVLLTTLACVATAAGLLAVRGPSYEATATILVTPLPSGDRSFGTLPLPRVIGDPQRAVETAAQVIEGRSSATGAASALGDVDAGFVENAVEVDADPDANVIAISATTDAPELSRRVADAYAAAGLEARATNLEPLVRDAIEDTERALEVESDQETSERLRARLADLRAIADGSDPTLSPAQPASLPTAPTGLARPVIIVLALLGGFALGTAAAVLVELLVSRRLQDEGDLLAVYPAPLLARVPEIGPALGRDPDELLHPSRAVGEAFRVLKAQLERRRSLEREGGRDGGARASARAGSVVLVASGSRGDGRTSTAVGLAQAVARSGERAVIVDLDLRAPSAARFTRAEPGANLAQVLLGAASLDDALAAVPGLEGAFVLAPPPPGGGVAERLLPMVSELVPELLQRAEWVIIDTPPLSESSDALAVAADAEQVVIVSAAERTPERQLAEARDLLEGFGRPATGHVFVTGRRLTRRERSTRQSAAPRVAASA